MSKKSFAELLGEVSATAQGGRRVADIVAALTPPPSDGTTAIAKAEAPPSTSRAVLSIVPGAIGAGAGALLWSRHRVLGAVAGHAVATTAVPILRGGPDRRRALCQLGVEGAAIAGSLLWDEHPVLGFGLGALGGVVATAFVPGSAANDLWKRVQGWRRGV